MTKVFHWANSSRVEQIIQSGTIVLEGSNNENAIKLGKAPLQIVELWKEMLKQYQAVGRYVWLTEQKRYAPNNFRPEDKVGFLYDASEIKARKWHHIQKELRDKNFKDADAFISRMNRSAQKGNGDDPYKWWCVDKDLTLNLCQGMYVWDAKTNEYKVKNLGDVIGGHTN